MDGDNEEVFDPKASVTEMLKTPQKDMWRESLVDMDGGEIIRCGVLKTNKGGGADVEIDRFNQSLKRHF